MVEGDCAQTDVRESEDRPYGERRFGCRHTQYRRGTIIHALRRNGGVGGDCLRAELFNCDDARTDVRQSEDRPYGFPLEDGDMRGAARSSTPYGIVSSRNDRGDRSGFVLEDLERNLSERLALQSTMVEGDNARTDVRQSEDRPYGFPLEDGDMRGAARSSTAYGGMEESVAIGARTDLARAKTVLRVTVGRW